MRFDLSSVPRPQDRVAIVTGANAGLETTKAFAKLGITTVMACRTEARALDAKARIEAEVDGAKLSILPLDLSDLASVRRFADAFRATHTSLDLAPSSRIVALSGNTHKTGQKRIVFEDLHWEKRYSAMDAYAQTKLACLMFGNALDRRLKEAGSRSWP